MYENILLRFPKIGLRIFKQLDNEHLAKCKTVCRSWNHFNNQNRLTWTRIIQKYQENHVEFKEDWKKVLLGVPLEIVKLLGTAVEEFYKLHPIRLKFQHSPLHISANQ